MNMQELKKLESECILSALKRGDVRTVKALTILAMLHPIEEQQTNTNEYLNTFDKK